jgi:hypothetical protein
MHRISLAVTDCCVYKDQKVQLAGLNIRARVGGVWVKGKQVSLDAKAAPEMPDFKRLCGIKAEMRTRHIGNSDCLSVRICQILYLSAAQQGDVAV